MKHIYLLFAENQTDRHFYLKKLLSSPQKGVEVIIDIDIEEVYQNVEKRAVFRQISQKLPTSDTTFLSSCQTKEFHESGESKMFFIDDIPLEIDQQFGCFLASTNDLEKTDLLFYSEPFRISKGQQDWSFLKKIKHPCNAIVLTDNYLLLNDKKYENIFSVLTTLMPENLDNTFCFQIMIIGDSKSDIHNIEDQRKDILKYLTEKFSYPIQLNIIRADHHGRYIHTNYFRIVSDRGFGVFSDRKISLRFETSVDCQPVTLSGRHATVHNTRLAELQKCVIAIDKVKRDPDKIAGSRQNRLLN